MTGASRPDGITGDPGYVFVAEESIPEAEEYHTLCLECGRFGPTLSVFAAAEMDGDSHIAEEHTDTLPDHAGYYTIDIGPAPDRPPLQPWERYAVAMAILRGMKLAAHQAAEGGAAG